MRRNNYLFFDGIINRMKRRGVIFLYILLAGIGLFFVSFPYVGHVQVEPNITLPLTWAQQRENMLATNTKLKVILLCHMRGGSTFVSELFNRNDEVLHWHEPHAAYYQATYGVKSWLASPYIIFERTVNKTYDFRSQPKLIVDGYASFSHNLLEGNFDQLPTRLFRHPLFRHSSKKLNNFKQCVDAAYGNKEKCTRYLPSACYESLEASISHDCVAMIKKTAFPTGISLSPNDTKYAPYIKYSNCSYMQRKEIDKCMPSLKHAYDASKMISYKGIRFTPETLEAVLQKDPDVHVIRLIRDPRAIASSRKSANLMGPRAKNAKYSVTIEAEDLCKQMRRDHVAYNDIANRYTGSMLSLKYEEVALEPIKHIVEVYTFIKQSIHPSLLRWLDNMVSGNLKEKATGFNTARRNLTKSFESWRSKYEHGTIAKMNSVCSDVLKLYNYST